jgi:hypothetical protein
MRIISSGPPDGAVVGRKLAADAAQLHEAVNGPQQVVGGYVVVEVEAVKQGLLSHCPLAHHGRDPTGCLGY